MNVFFLNFEISRMLDALKGMTPYEDMIILVPPRHPPLREATHRCSQAGRGSEWKLTSISST